MDPFSQSGFALRTDWGVSGARCATGDLAVVVDVLSFSTSVTIAVERGTVVYPFRWGRDAAADFAREHDAVLAVGRAEAVRDGVALPSLSPYSLLRAEPVPRLVLPSPNGSTVTEELRERGVQVVLGCLRNAAAVADHVEAAVSRGEVVTLIACGERWDDDSLRPALEDLLGVGAVLAALRDRGLGAEMSPESLAAAATFSALEPDLGRCLRDCGSGRELVGRGFGEDVDAALDRDVTATVPVLVDGAFVPG